MINTICISVGNKTLNVIQRSGVACGTNIFKCFNHRNYNENKYFSSTSNDRNDLDLEKLKTDTENFLKYIQSCKQLESKYVPLKSKKSRAEGFTVSNQIRVTGEKPPDKSPPVKSQVSLGFRPGAFHRGANVQGAFHLEPK